MDQSYSLLAAATLAVGCSGTHADSELTQDGLVFATSAVSGHRRVTVRLSESETGPVAFPTTGSLSVQAGDRQRGLDGAQRTGVSKRSLWVFGDLIVLRPRMAVSFDYVPQPGGKVVVDVPPLYQREVQVKMAREGVHLWAGVGEFGAE